jgi:DNA-binding MarR family transcriptional regulator
MGVSAEQCACELLEVVPLVMRAIRAEMRGHRGADLSVPQFRALNFLSANDGASLSDLAEFIGLALPSASKLIDGLVARKLVSRKACAGDRRRVNLALTAAGRAMLEIANKATQDYIAQRMIALPEAARATIVQAMGALRPIFTPAVFKEQP